MSSVPPSRTPLTRERVLDRALELADETGAEALSMRRLAGSLGVEAMSLYHHIANKEALLDALVERVAGEIYVPAGPGDWRSLLRRRALSARAVFRRHPWALGLLESRKNLDPTRLAACNATLGMFRSAGFSAKLAYQGFLTLDSYIYGFALQETSWHTAPAEIPAEIERTRPLIPEAQFPHIHEVMTVVTAARAAEEGPDAAYRAEFEFGLDLVLDGLERALALETGADGAKGETREGHRLR